MPRILIVEDDNMILRNIAAILRFEGYEVESAENGLEGAEKAREWHPDVVFSDIMMPDIDGFTLARRLRTDPATEAIRIVFMSAKVDPCTRAEAQALGAVAFLPKPFSMQELLAIARQQVGPAAHPNV